MFQEMVKVYNALNDEESKVIFDIRLEYAITGDKDKLRKAVYNLNKYEFTDLFEYIDSFPYGTGIVIFGAGSSGRYTCKLLNDYGYKENIIAYGDDDITKQGTEIDGLHVYSAVELHELFPNAIVVIASSTFGLDIYALLLRIGIERNHLYLPRYRRIMGMTGVQYFDLPYLQHEEHEVYIDGGAFDGETCNDFIKWCDGQYEKIIAFEPSRYFLLKCKQNLNIAKEERVLLINKGLYSEETELRFMHKAAGSKVSDSGADIIEVTSIDAVLDGQPATFIKLDVEGCELEALKGAKETILKCHPKLAISVYHKPEDIYEIPRFVIELVPQYKLYIRHYSNVESETILYAIP